MEPISIIFLRKPKITLDADDLIRRGGIVNEEKRQNTSGNLVGRKSKILYKNDLMMLDFIATNNWERPIYFTSPSTVEGVFDLTKYCHLEGGLAYRFMPLLADHLMEGIGGINVDRCYDLLVNKARWGGRLNEPNVYVDAESRRNSIMPKQNYLRLASALVDLNKMDSAVRVLDTCQKYFPNDKIYYDMYTLPMVEYYYAAGALEKVMRSQLLF